MNLIGRFTVQKDQLTRDERVRLEALAQAVASTAMQGLGEKAVLSRAMSFENYIRGGVKIDG